MARNLRKCLRENKKIILWKKINIHNNININIENAKIPGIEYWKFLFEENKRKEKKEFKVEIIYLRI